MGRAWQIWMHPRRTVREMEAMEESLLEYAGERTELESSVARLTSELEILAAEKGALAEQNDKLKGAVETVTEELMKTRRQLDTARQELTSSQDEDEMRREIERRIGEFEQLQKHYELRIMKLRERIRELQSAREPENHTANMEIIDMGGDTPAPATERSRRPDADSEWLRSLDGGE